MKTKLLPLLILAFMLSTAIYEEANAQQTLQVSSSERFIAYSLYNFSKLIVWPNSSTAKSFQVAIIGDKRVYVELQNLAQNRKVGNADYNIVFYKDISELKGYNQIIYLSNQQCSKISQLCSQIKNEGVLIVTERKDMTSQGSTIRGQKSGLTNSAIKAQSKRWSHWALKTHKTD